MKIPSYDEVMQDAEQERNNNFHKRKELIDKRYGTKYINRIKVILSDWYREIVDIVDSPTGQKQKCYYGWKYEYVEQICGYTGDDYSGFMYHQLPDGKYIKTYYCEAGF